MQSSIEDIREQKKTAPKGEAKPPFGSNEIRLNRRLWIIVIGIVMAVVIATPRVWKAFESFPTGSDYRIPYSLSKDYWLYERRLEQDASPDKVVILGDSVVWGEYVKPDGTLSHFLNESSGTPGEFLNCGVNGLFPLAMEGLVNHYGHALQSRKIIVQCNVLWQTSPQADLSGEKEERFNHARLIPQFFPRVPAYKASASERISASIENRFEFFQWTNHLQNAYYDQMGIPQWTLHEDDENPPGSPNAWRNPLAPFKAGIPVEPAIDPQRGPASPRHKPWNADGPELTHFDWVPLDRSIQWQAFQRTIAMLRERGNDVLVLVGPFNEHMIADDQRPTFRAIRAGMLTWLDQNHISAVAPETLPSDLYADASHPLTAGYARLAEALWKSADFRAWLLRPIPAAK